MAARLAGMPQCPAASVSPPRAVMPGPCAAGAPGTSRSPSKRFWSPAPSVKENYPNKGLPNPVRLAGANPPRHPCLPRRCPRWVPRPTPSPGHWVPQPRPSSRPGSCSSSGRKSRLHPRNAKPRASASAPRHDAALAAGPKRAQPAAGRAGTPSGHRGCQRDPPGPASILVNLRAQTGLAGSEVPCGVMGRREAACTPPVGRGHPPCTLLRCAVRMGEDRLHGTCPPKGHQSPPRCTRPARNPASLSPSQPHPTPHPSRIPLPIPAASLSPFQPHPSPHPSRTPLPIPAMPPPPAL